MSEQVRAVDIKSRTEKTYTIRLGGCEPRAWPYSKNRTYRPALLVVVKRDGNTASVELSGPQVKQDGTDGAQWAKERFYSGGSAWPAWMNSIIGGLA